MTNFRDFFLNAMGKSEEQFQEDCAKYLDKNKTYCFEGIGPANRIVTKYEENQLVYLSSFDTITGEEHQSPAVVEKLKSIDWNVRGIREYSFKTQEECMVALNALTDLEEGYVVRNLKTGERVKVKNAVYLAAHRLRGNGLTLNSICELVAMGEVDEYVAVFPEDKEKFEDAICTLKVMEELLRSQYAEFKHLETQKDFALAVKDLPLSGVMFKARKNGTDVIHELNQFPVNKRAEWLKERLTAENTHE